MGKADSPEGVVRLADVLESMGRVPRLTYRLDELAEAFGISKRTLERERSAGRFPKPDLMFGKVPLWRPKTIDAWIDKGGR
jgi:predicted DNA-binding transcriptional regulator AlpA